MAKKKVALVLSGGTSLGSYIAGALDELMHAFASSDKYEIDIITGASAGATTGAIIAHGLLYKKGKTALHDVWVKKIDIVDLIEGDIPAGQPPTLLSNRVLSQVARETLAWDSAQVAEPAPFCAADLTLAMALTNSEGLPYVSRIRQTTPDGGEEFVQFRHSEQQTFDFNSKALNPAPTDQIWNEVTEVAKASAAIPFVFPMVELTRQAGLPTHYIQTPRFQGQRKFLYYDGGTFNNLPVDLAAHYARQRAPKKADGKPNFSDRIIIIVNPWRSKLDAVGDTVNYPSLIEHAQGLFKAMRSESSAIQFDQEVIIPAKLANQPLGGQGIQGAFPGVDRADVQLLGNVFLVMPKAGDRRLRGNHLNALGAFLDQTFREYDFRRGAADAKIVAEELLDITYQSDHPPGFYAPDSDPDLNLGNLDFDKYENLGAIPSTRVPGKTVRQVFEDALDQRVGSVVKALVEQWNPPGPNIVAEGVLSGLARFYVSQNLPRIWSGG